MSKLRSFTAGGVAVGGLFLIGSLMESRESRVKGAYSSPVSVMNTTSAPAINSSMDDPGRIPYQAALASLPINCFGTICPATAPAVPAGHRVVLTGLSVWVQSAGNPGGSGIYLGGPSGTILSFPVTAYLGNSPNVYFLQAYQPIHTYFDGGQSPTVTVESLQGSLSSGLFTLIGYELDCTAAPCAPIRP